MGEVPFQRRLVELLKLEHEESESSGEPSLAKGFGHQKGGKQL